jgi:hypothetical protein
MTTTTIHTQHKQRSQKQPYIYSAQTTITIKSVGEKDEFSKHV